MNKKNMNPQKTLLHFWRSNSNNLENRYSSNHRNVLNKTNSNTNLKLNDVSNDINIIGDVDGDYDEDDDDDLALIEATDKFLNETCNKSLNTNSLKDHVLTAGIDTKSLTNTQFIECDGFDTNSGVIWIYPTNYPIREYQYNIVEKCLFKNSLVVLPTGMGKTFIAAVVMFNFYRWYPNGIVVFMAPTRPLVLQQAKACYEVMGIPKDDVTQMTGQMQPNDRKIKWASKRVFFLTPQVMANDIEKGFIDVDRIKCVVIDEAHKALGEYAFCKVVESVYKSNKNFRVVALTATPGGDIQAIQHVINKLLVSHIELRSDESIDMQKYNHNRQVNKYVVKLSNGIIDIKNAFFNVLKGPLKRLEMNRVLYIKDVSSLNKLCVLDRRDQFRKNPPPGLDQRRCALIEGDFAMIISFIHALELLVNYGLKSFFVFLKTFVEGEHNTSQQSRMKGELINNSEFNELYGTIKNAFENNDTSKISATILKHPKLVKLEKVIIDHFKNHTDGNTRVMIFSQYRESVYEIKEALSAYEPLIKVMEFVGQSAVQGTRKGVTQKEQLEVVKKFREGNFNTIVSTCVGEEGLDIGEVDLIICFDSSKSPIRLIQRMGRTGRKRAGKIIILLTEGKEEASYNTSLSKKKNIYKIILNSSKSLKFYQNNPLMIPKNLNPKCHKMFISVVEESEDTLEEAKNSKRRKSSLNKKSEISIDNDESLENNKIIKLTDKKSKVKITNQKSNDVIYANHSFESSEEKSLSVTYESGDFSRHLNNSTSRPDVFESACYLYEPPNESFLHNCLNLTDSNVEEVNLNNLLENWQSVEDDFLIGAKVNKSSNESITENKYERLFKEFILEERENETHKQKEPYNFEPERAEVSCNFVVNETIYKEDNNEALVNPVIVTNSIEKNVDADIFKVFNVNLNDLFMDAKKETNSDKNLMLCDKILENIDNCTGYGDDGYELKNIITCKENDENSDAIDSNLTKTNKSPILRKKLNSTSTPLRNINLKHRFSSTEDIKDDKSFVGITQAIQILNSSTHSVNCSFHNDMFLVNFDLKTPLGELFTNEMDVNISSNNSETCIILSPFTSNIPKRTSILKPVNKSIEFLDVTNKTASGLSENGEKSNNTTYDKSVILTKRARYKIKDLSLSFENLNEFNCEDNDQVEEDYEVVSEKIKSRVSKEKSRKNLKSNYIIDEAELSVEDGEEVSSDENDEKDDYDLKDSFFDQNNYTCNESMLYKYRQSLKNANENRNYIFNRPLRPITADIFSQAPQQDSSYLLDSFVVDDNEYEEENSLEAENEKYYDDSEIVEYKKPIKKSKRSVEDSLIAEIIEKQNEEALKATKFQKGTNKKLTRVKALSDDTVVDGDEPELLKPIEKNIKNTKVNNKLKEHYQINTIEQSVKQKSKKPWMIIDYEQMNLSPELIESLRKTSKDRFRILIEPNINCDYVVSHRVGILKVTPISRLYQCNTMIEKVQKAKEFFEEVIILANKEDDINSSPYFQRFIDKISDTTKVILCETINFANIILDYHKKEIESELEIIVDCTYIVNTKKDDMNFYKSLPNLSIVNALYLADYFETLQEFCKSSPKEMELIGKIDLCKAQIVHSFLND